MTSFSMSLLERIRMESHSDNLIKIKKKIKLLSNPTVEELIQKCPVGQQRTSKGKQFVFICGDYVYKGPFNLSDSNGKFQNLKERSDFMKKWGAKDILLPTSFIENNRREGWVVYKNLSKDMPTVTEIHQESFSNYSYPIVTKKSNIPKLLDFIKENQDYFFSNYDTYNLVLSYVYLFLFNTGDAGLYNVLIDDSKHQMYIIDYDETRKDVDIESLNELFYLTKSPAKEIRWFENTGIHYAKIYEKISEIRSDYPPGAFAKFDQTLFLLEKYYNLWNEKYGKSFSQKINQKSNQINQAHKIHKISQVSQIGEISEIRGGEIGKMVAAYRNSKTFSGYDFGVAKSALQKYIRRGTTGKALMVATEMYRMSELFHTSQSTVAKTNFTNFINRLCVIAAEDIGVANMPLCCSVIDYFNKTYKNDRIPPPIGEILVIVKELCESKKTRICSHAKNVYFNDECTEYARQKWEFEKDTEYTPEISEFISQNWKLGVLNRADDEMKNLCLAFLFRLKNKDFNCFAWLGYFISGLQLEKNEKKKISRNLNLRHLDQKRITFRRLGKEFNTNGNSPFILLWEVMQNLYNTAALNIFRDFFFSELGKDDTLIFLMVPIVAIIYDVPYGEISFQGRTLKREFVQKMMSGNYELNIDEDYIYDKHTKGGKRDDGAAGIKYFRQQSSHVENEDMKFRIESFFDTYVNCIPSS